MSHKNLGRAVVAHVLGMAMSPAAARLERCEKGQLADGELITF